jgi:hypothetical protein
MNSDEKLISANHKRKREDDIKWDEDDDQPAKRLCILEDDPVPYEDMPETRDIALAVNSDEKRFIPPELVNIIAGYLLFCSLVGDKGPPCEGLDCRLCKGCEYHCRCHICESCHEKWDPEDCGQACGEYRVVGYTYESCERCIECCPHHCFSCGKGEVHLDADGDWVCGRCDDSDGDD